MQQKPADSKAAQRHATAPTSPRRALDFGRSVRLASSFAPAAAASQSSPSRQVSPARRVGLIGTQPAPPRFARALSRERDAQSAEGSPQRAASRVPGPPPASVLQAVPRPGQPATAQPAASFRHRRYSIASSQPPAGRYATSTRPPSDAGPERTTLAPSRTTTAEVPRAKALAPLQRPAAARLPSPARGPGISHALASTSSMSGTIAALPVSNRAFATSTSLNASSRLASVDSAVAAALPRPATAPGDVRMQCADASGGANDVCLSRLLSTDSVENRAAASNVADDGGELDSLAGYSIGKVIGEGGFCQVKIGTHQLSGRSVAVKVINKVRAMAAQTFCARFVLP